MNIKYAKIIAICIVLIIPGVYFLWFGVYLESSLARQPDIWGQMGDFFGGVMNPLLTFLTVILLISSINHQSSANEALVSQIKMMEKNEKLKTFENLFFHLVQSQQNLYSKFKITIVKENEKYDIFTIQAVDKIETFFQEEKEHKGYEELKNIYKQLDKNYGIYDLLRAFSVVVNLIKDQLSDKNGFKSSDRIFYYEKLINLTEFANLRLICTALQFQNKTGAGLKLQDEEFQKVCQKLNFKVNNFYNLKVDDE
ncbi:hypothetical protein OHW83_07970 [Acinetobacter baumannii]|nr:hypothetical protein [Acinetobacter baumannii]